MPLTADQAEHLLKLVRDGERIPDAAQQVGVTHWQVKYRVTVDRAFAAELRAAVRHRWENVDRQPHGTLACYQKHGCRRPECRAAHTDYMRERRERKRDVSG